MPAAPPCRPSLPRSVYPVDSDHDDVRSCGTAVSDVTLATYSAERAARMKGECAHRVRALNQQNDAAAEKEAVLRRVQREQEQDATLQRPTPVEPRAGPSCVREEQKKFLQHEQKNFRERRRKSTEKREFFARFNALRMQGGETPPVSERRNSAPPSFAKGENNMSTSGGRVLMPESGHSRMGMEPPQIKKKSHDPRGHTPSASSPPRSVLLRARSTQAMITTTQRNTLWEIWNQQQDDDTQETRETSSVESSVALPQTAARAAPDTAASDTAQDCIDEIIALKLLVANQQATIDTLSSKLHSVERAYRRLFEGSRHGHFLLGAEGHTLAPPSGECREREMSAWMERTY